MIRVFISYRREGGELFARSISEHFLRKYKNIEMFYDIESMKTGNFNEQLYREIRSRDCFVLLLPKGALDRCTNPDDWVRLEIAHALRCKKPVIPLLMEGFEWPETLPEDIAAVRYKQGMIASNDLFEPRMEKLAKMIHEAVGKKYRPHHRASPLVILLAALLLIPAAAAVVRYSDLPAEVPETVPSAATQNSAVRTSSGFKISEPYLSLSAHPDSYGDYVWLAQPSQLRSLEYWISDSASGSAAVRKTLDGPSDSLHRIGTSVPGAECTLSLKAACADGTAFEDYYRLDPSGTEIKIPESPSGAIFPVLTVTQEDSELFLNVSSVSGIREYSYEWLGSNHTYTWDPPTRTSQNIELPGTPLPQWLAVSTLSENGNCQVDYFLIGPAE